MLALREIPQDMHEKCAHYNHCSAVACCNIPSLISARDKNCARP